MKYIWAIVSVLSLGAMGCGVHPMASVRPLYNEGEKPAAEPRLQGEWSSYDLHKSNNTGKGSLADAIHWRFQLLPGGCYEAERRSDDAKEIYHTCLVNLENKLFFDAQLSEKKIGQQMISANDMAPDMAAIHMPGRLWVQDGFIRFAALDSHWAEENVMPESRDKRGAATIFTGSTGQLRGVMQEHADDKRALTSAWYLCRPDVDCSLRVVEDELERAPNDPAVLSAAAEYFLDTGNFRRALALQTRDSEIEPADAEARIKLGWIRTCLRDYSPARNDFAAAAKLDPQAGAEVLIGISYFMEGNYAEASKVFTKEQASPKTAWAGNMALNYVSLARLGRAKEAESFLAHQMAQFVGTEEEQLLLLRATGRIKDYSPHFTDDEIGDGTAVFYALIRSAKGDREGARQALELTVNKLGPNHPFSVGAKLELGRLETTHVTAKR